MKSRKSENKSRTLNNNGLLLVFSGPSGAGKGTVCNQLLNRLSNIEFSVSATTRRIRPGEVDGVNYFFVSVERFEQMINNDELLEYDKHFENYYGTPKKYALEEISKGNHVILEIDVKGAAQVKSKYPQALTFFIDAPSREELIGRLRSRNTETEEQIRIRLARVDSEEKFKKNYDYVIINDNVDNATNQIINIIEGITK